MPRLNKNSYYLEIQNLEKMLSRIKAQEGNLLSFTCYTKDDYEVNWHHRVVAKIASDFAKGKKKRVILIMPPRCGKTELVSRRLVPLIHGINPQAEIILGTYNAALAADVTADIQRVMDQPEYAEIFPDSRITAANKKTDFPRNAHEHELLPTIDPVTKEVTFLKGKYRAQGVSGSFSGRGAHYCILDDLIKNRADADSEVIREAVWKWYVSTLRTRLEKDGSILITLTRWHEDDIVGRLLKLAKENPEADQWEVIRFPAIKEDESNAMDPRKIGEPLWPNKFSLAALMATKAAGARDWNSLQQGRPTSEEGNLFKREHFKFFTEWPKNYHEQIQSWDMAVKDKQTSDFTVGTMWGRIGPYKYLLAEERGHFSFPEVCNRLVRMSNAFPMGYKKLIEAKANGPAVKQTLDQTVTGIVEVEPRGDKVARVHAILPEFESGHVWFPSPSIAPWIEDFVEELCSFPNGMNDDRCDSVSQGLDALRGLKNVEMPTAGHGSGVMF